MSTIPEQHVGTFTRHFDKSLFAELTAGFAFETLGGAAAMVLAILGLAGVGGSYLVPIATLAVGAGLLIEGGVIIARYSDVVSEIEGVRGGGFELGSGVTAEFLGGAAGIVLGILALVGVVPTILTSVAMLVFGGALLLGSGATARLRYMDFWKTNESPKMEAMTREAMMAASGAQAVVALAAIVLGILALTHIQPAILTLVAILIIGASIVLSGSAMTTGFVTGWRSTK